MLLGATTDPHLWPDQHVTVQQQLLMVHVLLHGCIHQLQRCKQAGESGDGVHLQGPASAAEKEQHTKATGGSHHWLAQYTMILGRHVQPCLAQDIVVSSNHIHPCLSQHTINSHESIHPCLHSILCGAEAA